MAWLVLVFGLILLIVGADLLVRGAARLAGSLGVPTLVIGLTVVAFGTSAPEVAIGVDSALQGQAEFAIANVIGSNIFNTLFILGVAALLTPLAVSRQLIRQDVPIMVLATLVLVWFVSTDGISRWESILLLLSLIVYTLFIFYQGRRQTAAADDEVAGILSVHKPLWYNGVLVLAGLAMIVLGADWLVDSAVTIASALGVSEAVIALTIVAAGTSLPEVMTSVIAALKGERDIAVGNIVGSNIFNILGVIGISGLFAAEAMQVSEQLVRVDLPVMLGVAILCVPVFFARATLSRTDGLVFLVLYVAYVWYLVAVALSHAYVGVLQSTVVWGLFPVLVVYVLVSLLQDWRLRKSRASVSR